MSLYTPRKGFKAEVVDKHVKRGFFSDSYFVTVKLEDMKPAVRALPVSAEQYYDLTMGQVFTIFLHKHQNGLWYTQPEF